MNFFYLDWRKIRTLDDIKRVLMTLEVKYPRNSPSLQDVFDLVSDTPPPSMTSASVPRDILLVPVPEQVDVFGMPPPIVEEMPK